MHSINAGTKDALGAFSNTPTVIARTARSKLMVTLNDCTWSHMVHVSSCIPYNCSEREKPKKHCKVLSRMNGIERTLPNILITGTPGVGKSTLCQILAERTGLIWLDVSKLAIDNKCLEEFDQEYQCPVLDEDKLLDGMEGLMSEGGKIVDYHGSDFFPERWFDIVFVLRTDNTILYDRLTARGYTGKKLEDNIDCEIFQTILEEAKESYREEIVHELQSNTPADTEENVQRIFEWFTQWKIDNR